MSFVCTLGVACTACFFACKFTFCWRDFVPNLLWMLLWCDLEGRKGEWRGLKFILSMLWLFSIQGRFKGNRKWILNIFRINVWKFKFTLHLCHRRHYPSRLSLDTFLHHHLCMTSLQQFKKIWCNWRSEVKSLILFEGIGFRNLGIGTHKI